MSSGKLLCDNKLQESYSSFKIEDSKYIASRLDFKQLNF